uniref:Uncharacterized protein n=1 Tax=Chromera velia CCMP2878 TaxID=1169474 RepID=A0A0G4HDV4_9ALVE|eukprot:Cvel_26454.t1-p1 / transcript=Cvel_26454.t1 / gene=Cvel_26454 / organism=Chromera_velia_CCMP2878 / gene_product=hypothetical protein / transcript_product=hypothetical protein / location=Cvel_scaffold3146:2187-6170(+) / protein_length=512 / sequence_SO=supercontig / SO=protein_coding / is_pseudo=false
MGGFLRLFVPWKLSLLALLFVLHTPWIASPLSGSLGVGFMVAAFSFKPRIRRDALLWGVEGGRKGVSRGSEVPFSVLSAGLGSGRSSKSGKKSKGGVRGGSGLEGEDVRATVLRVLEEDQGGEEETGRKGEGKGSSKDAHTSEEDWQYYLKAMKGEVKLSKEEEEELLRRQPETLEKVKESLKDLEKDNSPIATMLKSFAESQLGISVDGSVMKPLEEEGEEAKLTPEEEEFWKKNDDADSKAEAEASTAASSLRLTKSPEEIEAERQYVSKDQRLRTFFKTDDEEIRELDADEYRNWVQLGIITCSAVVYNKQEEFGDEAEFASKAIEALAKWKPRKKGDYLDDQKPQQNLGGFNFGNSKKEWVFSAPVGAFKDGNLDAVAALEISREKVAVKILAVNPMLLGAPTNVGEWLLRGLKWIADVHLEMPLDVSALSEFYGGHYTDFMRALEEDEQRVLAAEEEARREAFAALVEGAGVEVEEETREGEGGLHGRERAVEVDGERKREREYQER